VRFLRVLKRFREKTPMKPRGGRPRIIEEASIQSVLQKAAGKDIHHDSFTLSEICLELEEKRFGQLRASGRNPHVYLQQLSRSTRKRVLQKVGVKPFNSANLKTTTRIRALQEIYNPLTAVAAVSNFQDCFPETFVSIDSVGLDIGDKMGAKYTVYLAPGSLKYLKERNQTPSRAKKVEQYRVVHCTVAHTAGGKYVCAVQLVDEDFTEMKVYALNDVISIWYLPVKFDRVKFFSDFLINHVIPMVNTERCKIASLNDNILPVGSVSEQASNPGKHYKDIRTVLTFDGESAQVVSAQSPMVLDKCKEEKIELLKWAAATSLVQQPADVGKMHLILHDYFKSNHGKSFSTQSTPSTHMKMFVQGIFQQCELGAASKDRFRYFLENIEFAMNKSFTAANIATAWKTAGYFPFSQIQIMSGWSQWKDIDGGLATKILGCEKF
jgi:hypothetical protein